MSFLIGFALGCLAGLALAYGYYLFIAFRYWTNR